MVRSTGRRAARWLVLLLVAGAAVGQPASDLAALAAAVEGEEAVRAIKRLQHAYAHYQEAGAWQELGELFSDRATAEFPGGVHLSGRTAIRRHLMRLAGRDAAGLAPGQLNVHLIMQPIVTLGSDGRTAHGTWHDMALLGRHGESARWVGGIQENDYVLEGGTWKIARLRWVEQYRGDYDDYGHVAPPRWNVPYHFEARHVGVTLPAAALAALASRAAPVALPQRVQALEDENAVRNLQHALGYYLDRKMWDDVADLFASDGSLEIAPRGAWVGQARIRRALEAWYGPPTLARGELFDHILVATVVTVGADGRSASARSTQLAMIGRNGEFARWEQGVYENSFVKDGGVWKLKSVRYFPRLVTDYDAGWARDAQPVPDVPAALPPDGPGAAAWAAYPATRYVGFHFTHPVTGRATRLPRGLVVDVPRVETAARHSTSGDARVDLADLRRRVDAQIGVDAAENLMSSYGYYIDESAWDEMADTYARTGAKEITGAGVYVGPERIRHILKLRGPLGGRTPNFFTIHQLTQPVIHVREGKAWVRARLFQCGGNADGSSGSWLGGIYENTAVLENGEWKFGIQDLHHIFNASYRNGWARVGAEMRGRPLAGRAPGPRDAAGGGISQGLGGARPGNRLASEFPPDRPIRARQYSFPEISEPAFHYANPVSGREPPWRLEH